MQKLNTLVLIFCILAFCPKTSSMTVSLNGYILPRIVFCFANYVSFEEFKNKCLLWFFFHFSLKKFVPQLLVAELLHCSCHWDLFNDGTMQKLLLYRINWTAFWDKLCLLWKISMINIRNIKLFARLNVSFKNNVLCFTKTSWNNDNTRFKLKWLWLLSNKRWPCIYYIIFKLDLSSKSSCQSKG